MTNEINQFMLELDVNCPKDKAWDIMLNHMSDWWPKDFLCLEGSPEIKFEPWAGGRLYEETEAGAHILWAHVVMIQPGSFIETVGAITPTFGGPSMNYCRMALEEGEGGTTKFKLTNTVMGYSKPEGKPRIEMGWNYLFGAFKAYCEK
jgi:hypothetical protein